MLLRLELLSQDVLRIILWVLVLITVLDPSSIGIGFSSWTQVLNWGLGRCIENLSLRNNNRYADLNFIDASIK